MEHENGWKSGDDGVYEVAMTAEERVEAAALVVADLQARHNLATSVIESYQATVRERDAHIMRLEARMVEMAGDLARAADDSHAGKNIIILRVVGRLLMIGNRAQRSRDVDDIPF